MKLYIDTKAWSILFSICSYNSFAQESDKYNVVFVFADQLRAQDLGYNGNPDVITPNIDALAKESINLKYTFSGCPVSTPYRGSLMTGCYPLTTGVFLNDVQLDPESESIGKVYKKNGYNTAYIGKWHLDGNGRKNFIPKDRRQGFDYWKVLECTHDYMNSYYWDNDDSLKKWNGYDAFAQTKDACQYIKNHAADKKPFLLFLSFGPPHEPYDEVEDSYKNLYLNKNLQIRKNVPEKFREKATKALQGYYAHITSLDLCIKNLQQTIKECNIEKNTIFVFTSDHGDMLFSQGAQKKQRPWDESIWVPFLLKYPSDYKKKPKVSSVLLDTPDIMPTLLGLCKIPVPSSVEGEDLSGIILGKKKDHTKAVLIASYHAFGQWSKQNGGREYRGVRTRQYTYVRSLDGDWMLYDNVKDPYQLNNLISSPQYELIKKELNRLLIRKLDVLNDKFLPGEKYIKKWKYEVDETGSIPYRKFDKP